MAFLPGLFAAIGSAVSFVFSSGSIIAQAIRFVGGTILSQLLAGQTKTEGPRLSDLKVQVSTYGNPIPRVYGEAVRIAGNVIDKSDLIEKRKKKTKKMLGMKVASSTTYSYSVNLAVLIADGELPPSALRKVYANGKVIYDRDAAVMPAEDATGVPVPWGTTHPEFFTPAALAVGRLGVIFNRHTTKSMAKFTRLAFYPGSATQLVDPMIQALHIGRNCPAYRHTAYCVIEGLQLADYGNGVPNIEFEVETNFRTIRDTVEDLGSYADVQINAWQLSRNLRGYVVAKAGSVWSAIEPLAGAFAFDLISDGADFRAKARAGAVRTILDPTQFAARPIKDSPGDRLKAQRQDPNTYPDTVTVTYMDATRDYQTNTQMAFRNHSFAQNKEDLELPIVFTDADEPRNIAQRALSEAMAKVNALEITVSDKLNWLEAGDLVGIPIGEVTHPFRFTNKTEAPNGVITYEAVLEDTLAYLRNIIHGDSGSVPDNSLQLPGDTIFQPVDAGIIEDVDDDTGFYVAFAGTGNAWVGADIDRAKGVGSPLSYDAITDTVVQATIGDCIGTLADGTTEYIDRVSTIEVHLLGGDNPVSTTEALMLTNNTNFAWIGPASGEGGEYINFTTATPTGSPNSWILSGLLRGRRGTEFAVGTHVASERFVLMNTAEVNRMDFGPADWTVTNTYRSTSVDQDDVDGLTVAFTNTGEGKRPLAPVLLRGDRNDANNDILLSWTRRTRYQTPTLGGGPVPLGEAVEAYHLDIYSGASIVRSVDLTAASFNYTAAMQVTDAHTAATPVKIDVYQVSDVRGRGHLSQGTV